MMKLAALLLANCDYYPTTTLQIKIYGSNLRAKYISFTTALIEYGEFDVRLFKGTYIVLSEKKTHEKEKNNFARR